MNDNQNKNSNKNSNQNKNKKNFNGLLMLLGWAVVLTVVFNYLAAYSQQADTASSTHEISYSEFLELVEEGHVAEVLLTDGMLEITPVEGYVYTDKDGRTYGDDVTLFTMQIGVYDMDLSDFLTAHGVEFRNPYVPEISPVLEFMLSYILPTVLMVGAFVLLMNLMTKRSGGIGGIGSVGKSNAKVYMEKTTGVTFADVAGQDEAKEALAEIVDFLHSPDKYRSVGAVMPKGALLVGPPGTGKTLLAKAVAGEAGVPFFSISGSEFVEMFVGMGAARVRDLFKQAAEKAPCIVFIDEIDTIGKRRDSSLGGNDEREQTLNQLLSEMDGFDGSKGVIILAATNRPETLDPALLRPGRFDRRIPVELPDLNGRVAILKVHAKDVHVASGVDWNVIARATAGASGAELANIINEGALRAVRCGRDTVEQQDFEEAVETVIAGYQRKDAAINEHEKQVVAYHEIGHALVAAKQKDSAPVHKITIVPRTSGALGYTMQVDEQERKLMTKEEALAKVATLTGGRAAEELIFGTGSSGASNDIEQATKIARTMITRFGMSNTFDMMALETVTNQYLGGDTSLICSAETAAKVDAEVLQIIKSCHARASEILSENIDKLHQLAAYLLEKETITGDEFMAILNDAGQPQQA